jgi:hypothetical protein
MYRVRVTYRQRSDATPEDEVRVLAAVYRLVLKGHAEKAKGAHPGTPDDDVREEENAHTAKRIIPE